MTDTLQDFAQDRADALFRERSENHHCPGCTGHLLADPTAEELAERDRFRKSYGITSGLEALEDVTSMVNSIQHAVDDVRSALEEVYPENSPLAWIARPEFSIRDLKDWVAFIRSALVEEEKR